MEMGLSEGRKGGRWRRAGGRKWRAGGRKVRGEGEGEGVEKGGERAGNSKKGGKFETSRMRVLSDPQLGDEGKV